MDKDKKKELQDAITKDMKVIKKQLDELREKYKPHLAKITYGGYISQDIGGNVTGQTGLKVYIGNDSPLTVW